MIEPERSDGPQCYVPGHHTRYVVTRGNGKRLDRCHECLKYGNRNAANARHRRLRRAALVAYSQDPPSCACCAIEIEEFLAIDHVDGDGSSHRKAIGASGSTSIYRWLAKNGYPPGFAVLCHNCNYAKHVYGVCPHRAGEVMSNGLPT